MSKKTNLWVDATIFIAFLVAFEPNLTGETIHEWLSLALAATLIVHVVLHWDWIMKVGVQFFRKLFHTSRLNFVIDALLFVASVMLMLSGILISRSIVNVLGIQLNPSMVWRQLHSWSADVCLILVGLHFALHWKWIVDAVTRYGIKPIGRVLFPRKSQPAPVVIPVEEK
ncbi:MAG: DUF4405 domain-containing protein [Chloroflexi bacterium]|nr:DUF4405 domain-containing protein [Chloroflexota bacterium]